MDSARIMVVEDEYIVAADLRERLENMGYSVCGFLHSGEDTLAQLATETPDLILMDIIINGAMDGIELSMKIKDSNPVPIVFLTAHATVSILERAKLSEPFGYVVKPFKDRELQAVIEMALYRAAMEKQLRESNERLKSALAEVRYLSGLLPICARCKKIRDDKGYWHQVEMYIQERSDAKFSHSICPDCARKLYPDIAEMMEQ